MCHRTNVSADTHATRQRSLVVSDGYLDKHSVQTVEHLVELLAHLEPLSVATAA